MIPPTTCSVVAVCANRRRVVLQTGLTAEQARQYVDLLDLLNPAYADQTIEIHPLGPSGMDSLPP